MSTYSPSLRIELITTGTQAGTWGNTTNTNLGGLIESAIAGYVSVSITSANQALTALNGAADESRHMAIALTTTTVANFNVYAPPAEKTYIIYNASAYAATIYNSTVIGNTTAAGTGVAVPAGKTMTIWSDGTNFRVQNDHLSSLTLTTDLAVADGGTGASSFTSGGLLRGNGASALSVASAADIVGQIGATAVTNATNATNATNINISATTSTDTTTSLVLVGSQATGNQPPFIDAELSYNASTNVLSANGFFVGAGSFTTTNWTVAEVSGKLVFSHGGVAKYSIDSSGNMIVTGNVTAYGTP
jgi:hypothetical protein